MEGWVISTEGGHCKWAAMLFSEVSKRTTSFLRRRVASTLVLQPWLALHFYTVNEHSNCSGFANFHSCCSCQLVMTCCGCKPNCCSNSCRVSWGHTWSSWKTYTFNKIMACYVFEWKFIFNWTILPIKKLRSLHRHLMITKLAKYGY